MKGIINRNKKIRKNVMVFAIVFTLMVGSLLGSVPHIAKAADPYAKLIVSSSKTEVNVGDTITVTVDLDMSAGVCYKELGFDLSYNKDALQLISYTNGTVYTDVTITHETAESEWENMSVYDIIWDAEEGDTDYINTGARLLTITFTVLKTDSDSKIGFSRKTTWGPSTNPDLEEVEVDLTCGHANTTANVTTNPTCGTVGKKTYTCNSCSKTVKTEDVPVVAHSFGAWSVVDEATCSTAGSKQRVCTMCKKETETEAISATGHTEGQWETTKEATCTEAGTKTKECTECKEVIDTETISATGHTEGQWETIKEATCTEAGTKTKECTECKEVVDTETIKATGHSYGEWKVVTESTYEAEGKEARICSLCKDEETRAIAKLDSPNTDDTTTTTTTTDINTGDTTTTTTDTNTEDTATTATTSTEVQATTSTTEDVNVDDNVRTGDFPSVYAVMFIMLISLGGIFAVRAKSTR